MLRKTLLWAMVIGLGTASARALPPEVTPATKPGEPASQPMHQPADMPAVKLGRTGLPDPRFISMHQYFLAMERVQKPNVVFLGDSITERWMHGPDKDQSGGPDNYPRLVWEKSFGKYDPMNLGIGGDRTEHVLWRMDNGELNNIHPRVLVLMIGTNNTGNYTAEEITAADKKIIAELHEKLPDTKLLVLGIFPRGNNPKDHKTAVLRDKISSVNKELAKLDDGSKTRYLDLTPNFLTPDGLLSKEIMPDYLHPNTKGLQIWADAMGPLLKEMMEAK